MNTSVIDLLNEARKAFERALYGRACVLLKPLVDDDPPSRLRPIALLMLGLSRQVRGEEGGAYTAYKEGMLGYAPIDPGLPQELGAILALAMVSFGHLLIDKNELSEAESILRTVVSDPVLSRSWMINVAKTSLGQICLETDRHSEAVALYRDAVEGLRTTRYALFHPLEGLARSLLELGDYSGAEASLLEAVSEDPPHETKAVILALMADVLYRVGNPELSTAYLEESRHFLGLVPGSNEDTTTLWVATVALNVNRPEVALEILGRLSGSGVSPETKNAATVIAAQSLYLKQDFAKCLELCHQRLPEVLRTKHELLVRKLLIFSNARLGNWSNVDDQVGLLELAGLLDQDRELAEWIRNKKDVPPWTRLTRMLFRLR